MKGSKVIAMLLGILVGLAILGGLAAAFAGLVMLMWNIMGVAALSTAVSLTFLTTLKGVGIIYGMIGLVTIIRTVIHNSIQRLQMGAALKMMQQIDEEMKGTQAQKRDFDFLKHFRM